MKDLKFLWLASILALIGWFPAGQDRARVVTADTTLVIQTFQFKPKTLEIAAGTTVTWTNTDAIEHTITSGDGEKADGRFNGVTDGKGRSFRFTFTQPGVFQYFCDRHHFMRGEIRVH